MSSPKASLMATALSLTTAIAIGATVLHFTPWPHGQSVTDPSLQNSQEIHSEDVIELPYTAEDLMQSQYPKNISITRNEWPKYVHLKDEPYHMLHPIKLSNKQDLCASLIWATVEYEPGKTFPIGLHKPTK